MPGYGVENLPYGVVRRPGGEPQPAVRFGDGAVVLAEVLDDPVFREPTLNAFIAQGPDAWGRVRERVGELVTGGAPLVALSDVETVLPVAVGDYVDFYSSLEHATNVGRLLRPDDPLMPNWRHLPVGYHGRAGTVVASGTPIRRPSGQLGPGEFGPEPALDFELELGYVTDGRGHIFGFTLVNDWSARRMQAWEYQPLGPFLSKAFATSISPWIVPAEALEPFRVAGPEQDPEPLPHLHVDEPRALDIDLEVELNGEVIARTNARHLYWSHEQQLAHVMSAGITPKAGDLFASGTISSAEGYGCLLEKGGPFLEDGDEVVMRGIAGAISFGEVRGMVASGGSPPSRLR
jgi:fumarylacetoacetase